MGATPSSSTAQLRTDLAVYTEFDLIADRRGFIGHRVLPVFEVELAGDTFPKVVVESILRNVDTRRAPRAPYPSDNWEWTTDTYATEEHGFEEKIDDRERRKYRHLIEYETICAERAVDAVLRGAERRAAQMIFNPTTFASHTTAVTNEWDDFTSADPISDVETARTAIWEACGLEANCLVISRPVFRNLRRCENIIDKIHSEGAGQSIIQSRINDALLAEIFDLDMVLVAGGTQNLANRAQAASFARIWSDEYAWLGVVATDNDLRKPCIGRTFHWADDGSNILGTFETYRNEEIRSDVVRCRNDTDEKLITIECGHLLANITTKSDGASS